MRHVLVSPIGKNRSSVLQTLKILHIHTSGLAKYTSCRSCIQEINTHHTHFWRVSLIYSSIRIQLEGVIFLISNPVNHHDCDFSLCRISILNFRCTVPRIIAKVAREIWILVLIIGPCFVITVDHQAQIICRFQLSAIINRCLHQTWRSGSFHNLMSHHLLAIKESLLSCG